MNIGPRSDGTIPQEVQQILLETGAWLKVNGEAIYGTQPCRQFGEGPTRIVPGPLHDVDSQAFTAQDFRFTCKNNIVYAIEMAWPAAGDAIIHSFGSDIVRSITMLDSGKQLEFRQESDGLHIQLPDQLVGNYAYVFQIELSPTAHFQRTE